MTPIFPSEKRMSIGWNPSDDDDSDRPHPRRSWSDKFAEAFRGVKQGVRGESSFYVHFFFAALAILVGVILECGWVEWCLVTIAIGLVLTAELFNTSLETLFHGLDRDTKDRLVGVLDISAGAVLVASATSVVVGGIVFGRKLLIFAGWL